MIVLSTKWTAGMGTYAVDTNGKIFNDEFLSPTTVARAHKFDQVIIQLPSGNWKRIDKSDIKTYEIKFSKASDKRTPKVTKDTITQEEFNEKKVATAEEQSDVLAFINKAEDFKPKSLIMNPLKWKFLVRSVVRGKNIMMTGPAGTGKTMTANSVAFGLNRPFFYFNLGSTQDPRTTLIGNTQFKDGEGTFFNQSLFITAIQTKDAVILLDELTRAHPEAWNILMTVLDQGQRYLRLDEKVDSPTIKVADGVSFIATANIGNEYTATRVLDRALLDRFVIVEMDVLTKVQETGLLVNLFPNVPVQAIESIAEITSITRTEVLLDNPKLTTIISTRMAVEIAGLLNDGFRLAEAAEVAIYPFYSQDGGMDSERVYIKQIVQKFCNDGTSDDLFNIGTDTVSVDNEF